MKGILGLGIILTFGIFLQHCMAELNNVIGFIIVDVLAEDHIFVEIACIGEYWQEVLPP